LCGLVWLGADFEAVAEVPSLPALEVVADYGAFYSVWLYSSIRYKLFDSILTKDWK
jgi:hypothetical protein